MKRFLLVLMLLIPMALSACGKDPDTADLERYVQTDLFQIRTNLRAGRDQYDSSRSKNDLTRANLIRTKVIYQYEKYLNGLKAIQNETAFVDRLHEEGIQRVTEAITALDSYGKALVNRDSHLMLRTRMDAEAAIDKIEKWQRKVWEEAQVRNISIPSDNVR